MDIFETRILLGKMLDELVIQGEQIHLAVHGKPVNATIDLSTFKGAGSFSKTSIGVITWHNNCYQMQEFSFEANHVIAITLSTKATFTSVNVEKVLHV